MRNHRNKAQLGLLALTTSLISFGPFVSAGVAAECVPKEVDISEFIVDGEPDLEAYLAAVAAANAVCGANVPSTGSDVTDMLPFGVALIGAGGLAFGLRRRFIARSS